MFPVLCIVNNAAVNICEQTSWFLCELHLQEKHLSMTTDLPGRRKFAQGFPVGWGRQGGKERVGKCSCVKNSLDIHRSWTLRTRPPALKHKCSLTPHAWAIGLILKCHIICQSSTPAVGIWGCRQLLRGPLGVQAASSDLFPLSGLRVCIWARWALGAFNFNAVPIERS